jgi:hypothetical protein
MASMLIRLTHRLREAGIGEIEAGTLAAAMLRELKHPTAAMVLAGRNCFGYENERAEARAREVYGAMIEAGSVP